jgi:uncharacterized hydrophobic protein (TIGR00341 family)
MIAISAPDSTVPTLLKKAEELGVSGVRTFKESQKEDRTTLHMLSAGDNRQDVVDAMQSALSSQSDWRLTILPVETTIPLPREEEEAVEEAEKDLKRKIGGRTREEIWNDVWEQAQTDQTYLVFVVLSTVVAALGLVQDNVAVVVGAMVIAPLLGPNLAFAVGVSLGDRSLILRALKTNAAGLGIAFGFSVLIGLVWPLNMESGELMGRADVNFGGMAIALASGAAAALSLVTGVSSALVGVMVAVALLPPTAALGLFAGAGQTSLAMGALLLLSVNIVSVNLSAQTVLFWRGVRPRTFYEEKEARIGRIVAGVFWVVTLAILAALMWWRVHT